MKVITDFIKLDNTNFENNMIKIAISKTCITVAFNGFYQGNIKLGDEYYIIFSCRRVYVLPSQYNADGVLGLYENVVVKINIKHVNHISHISNVEVCEKCHQEIRVLGNEHIQCNYPVYHLNCDGEIELFEFFKLKKVGSVRCK